MQRPKDVKKAEQVQRCALLDAERVTFLDLVDFIVDLVPLQFGCSAENYIRIGILQPEAEV